MTLFYLYELNTFTKIDAFILEGKTSKVMINSKIITRQNKQCDSYFLAAAFAV